MLCRYSRLLSNARLNRQKDPRNAHLHPSNASQPYGTTSSPIDFADDMTDLHSPDNERPDRRVSDCLIFAIS